MYKLVSVAEMQLIEREADAQGLSYKQMMDNAGYSLAKQVESAYGQIQPKHVLGLVGSGNNGGDALVALAYLIDKGWDASVYIVKSRPDNDILLEHFMGKRGKITKAEEDLDFELLKNLMEQNGVLIDGVLGTGARLPINTDIARCLDRARQYLNERGRVLHVVAVDIPSGIDCDCGEVAPETIPAELTVTMAAVKRGILSIPAFELIGKLSVGSIGDLEHLPSWRSLNRWVVGAEDIRRILPSRPLDSHKGTFGTALIVAGSVNYTGAAFLAGYAAYRSGAGLVTMAVPALLHPILAGHFPEATWILLPTEKGVISVDGVQVIKENLKRATALLVGPGFGLESTTQEFLDQLFEGKYQYEGDKSEKLPGSDVNVLDLNRHLPPVVVDADGLKLLSRIQDWNNRLPSCSVLTPHPGEMEVLTGLTRGEIQADRISVAERFAKEWGHVVVLKGAFTVISNPNGQTAVIPVATPALARAGSGDVLAGLIVGLIAQKVEPFNAAVAGAWIHGQAGLRAEEEIGNSASVLAGDILDCVAKVLSELI
jgi:ADP-dependent NAD(P)H-hydrate dehydratase / NAD(P)H-hydrate epimerase